MTIEELYEKYKERILTIMDGMRQELTEAGYTVSETWDEIVDDYRWSIVVYIDDGAPARCEEDDPSEEDVDIVFEICESQQYEGSDDGITFSISITRVGGEILGGYSPFNYTPKVWVPLDDEEAIEERFALFEQLDHSKVIHLL